MSSTVPNCVVLVLLWALNSIYSTFKDTCGIIYGIVNYCAQLLYWRAMPSTTTWTATYTYFMGIICNLRYCEPLRARNLVTVDLIAHVFCGRLMPIMAPYFAMCTYFMDSVIYGIVLPLTFAGIFLLGIRCHLRHPKPLRALVIRAYEIIQCTANRWLHVLYGLTQSCMALQTSTVSKPLLEFALQT